MLDESRSGEWRRLHPLTIVKELGAVAWAFVGAVVFDFAIPGIPEDFGNTEAIVAVGVFGFAVLRYVFIGYRLTDHTLEMRRGVFIKRHRVMPLDRVQSVGVKTGLAGRFLGVTSVEVSAADTEEIALSFVSHHDAGWLRKLLDPSDHAGADPGQPAKRTGLARVDPGSLVVYAVTDSGVVMGAVVAAAAIGFMVFSGAVFAPLLIVVPLWWPILRAMGLVSFESWIEDNRLKVSRGLLNRRETDAPLVRIQTIRVDRPPLRRLSGHETVELATGDISGSLDDGLSDGLVAPLVEIGEWRWLAERLIGRVELGETDLRRPSRHAIRRAVVRGVVATGVMAAAGGVGGWLAGVGPAPAVGVLIVGLVVSVLYARARWRRLGWVADDRHLLVRRGVIRHTLAVVPVGKVQDVTVRATLFQRRFDLATVVVDTAGVAVAGSVRAIDLESADAHRLARHLAESAARIALPDGV